MKSEQAKNPPQQLMSVCGVDRACPVQIIDQKCNCKYSQRRCPFERDTVAGARVSKILELERIIAKKLGWLQGVR